MSLQRSTLLTFIVPATLFLAAALRADDAKATDPMTLTESSLLQRFDTNGDGKLDENELADAHDAMRAAPGTKLPGNRSIYAQLLQRFDLKQEGKLDPAEQAQAVQFLQQSRPKIYQAILKRFDRDRNGKLDAAEAAALFDAFGQRMAAMAKPTP